MKTLSIRETAKLLNVGLDTLRRWDKTGKLVAIRHSPRGHRYYDIRNVEQVIEQNPEKYLTRLAMQWAAAEKAYEPMPLYYCQTTVLFQTRLMKMQQLLSMNTNITNVFSLLVAVSGEIGNNSFDHNLGKWQDAPGIFFGYSPKGKKIVLADRGQGIFKTLKRVRPNLATDFEALETAFTEIVTGRAPEHQGNGLKFVKKILEQQPQWKLFFQSGNASVTIENGKIQFSLTKKNINGCIAIIEF